MTYIQQKKQWYSNLLKSDPDSAEFIKTVSEQFGGLEVIEHIKNDGTGAVRIDNKTQTMTRIT